LENIFVIGNKRHIYEIKKQLSRFKILSKNILLEPQGKNTAPAIGLAAVRILSRDPNAIMLILPSDHLISKENKFLQTLKRAKEIATNGYLVTLGIPPKYPETGYGYIKIKSKIKNQKSKIIYYEVERFCEKPTLRKAKEFIKDKRYYWNSGIFIFKAKVILEEIRKYLPELYKKLNEITCLPDRQVKSKKLERIWKKLKPISIDYGIMEKTKQAVMIPVKFGWRDLGNWRALDELLPKDNLGNILEGNSLDLGSKNITIFGDKRLIATVGLSNIIIVDTSDALLVCRKDQARDVKRIVEELTKKGQKDNL
jgi:mannose-1-phosphate guanylyltransferase/mannose-6-phosphate isomerase